MQVTPAPPPGSPLLPPFVHPKPLAQAWHRATCLIKCSLTALVTVFATTATVSAFRGYTAQEWGHRELTTALNALLSVPPTWPRTCGDSGKDPYEPGRRGGCLPSWLCGNRGGKTISGAGPVFKLPILCSFWIFAPISKKHGFKTLFEIFWHPL